MMLVTGCGRTSEFVMTDGVDRNFVNQGDSSKCLADDDCVFLSTRAFKHYSKGCE